MWHPNVSCEVTVTGLWPPADLWVFDSTISFVCVLWVDFLFVFWSDCVVTSFYVTWLVMAMSKKCLFHWHDFTLVCQKTNLPSWALSKHHEQNSWCAFSYVVSPGLFYFFVLCFVLYVCLLFLTTRQLYILLLLLLLPVCLRRSLVNYLAS